LRALRAAEGQERASLRLCVSARTPFPSSRLRVNQLEVGAAPFPKLRCDRSLVLYRVFTLFR